MQETKEFVECEGGDGKLNDARSKVMVRFSLPGHLPNDHSLSLLANCYHPPTWCFGHSSITLTRKTSAICIRKLFFYQDSDLLESYICSQGQIVWRLHFMSPCRPTSKVLRRVCVNACLFVVFTKRHALGSGHPHSDTKNCWWITGRVSSCSVNSPSV